ncbi:MAG: DUF1501 domain-containing protein [Actinomycetota bacterium]
MISIEQRGQTRLCDSVARREILRAGGLTALGLSLAGWNRAEAAGAVKSRGTAKSVILIFNCGGPGHTDTFDMKPNAPSDVRGTFNPIKTNVSGIEICELMPSVAKHADKLALVRSVHHTQSQHNTGMYWSIVGRPYAIDSTLINPSRNDYPSFGTLAGWLAQRDGYSKAVPPYVITPAPHCDSTVYITPGQYGGMLGNRFDPFVLNSDPNKRDFKLPSLEPLPGLTVQRMRNRQSLLQDLDLGLQSLDEQAFRDLDVAQQKAFSLVTSSEVRRAFDLSEEPDKVRDRYGRHTWGQSHLLSRRLIEAGTKFVTTVNGQSIIWDTHKDNFPRMKDTLMPPMEKAYSALLEDLSDRGLLDETLVIWMGDFGRTPKINGDGGRDHWPQCYTMVLAGGGIKGGQIVGESDATGAYPISRPVTPADIHATVFHALGYDPHVTTYPSLDGRPIPLTEGSPIMELF